jgi:ABC-type uncharacterized transport system auxiliary subunit
MNHGKGGNGAMTIKNGLFIVLAICFLTGCFGSKVPSVPVKHYTLEYAPPYVESRTVANGVIKVERFTGATEYLSRDMVYRPQPFVRDTYRYHRWNAAPVDMIQGLLVRDIRQGGGFKAVLSYEDTGVARYIVEGQLMEFIEVDEKNRIVASLVIGITFMDTVKEHAAERILFQKIYRIAEPLGLSKEPRALAQSMSAAMARFSGELIGDLQSATTASTK